MDWEKEVTIMNYQLRQGALILTTILFVSMLFAVPVLAGDASHLPKPKSLSTQNFEKKTALVGCGYDSLTRNGLTAKSDADCDGIANAADLCPNTPSNVEGGVDSSGCSAWQFCSAIDVSSWNANFDSCTFADWKNNEPGYARWPYDCTLQNNARTGRNTCVVTTYQSRGHTYLLAN